jgi:pimeloyl-ACP methyl ester carboxylesterase
MQFLDLFIVGLSLFMFILLLNKNKLNQKIILLFMIFTAIGLIIHSSFGQAKWQLSPLLLFWILFIMFDLIKPSRKFFKVLFIVMSTLSIFLSLGFLYAFPAYEIPNPRGSYPIGQFTFHIEDEDRLELYTDDPVDTRKFTFTMWYPALNMPSKEPLPWIQNNDISKRLSTSIGLPSFVLNQINNIESNAYWFPLMSNEEETYPVVIISHGWGGFMHLHTDLAEELASQGYIVISIDHTYGSVATKLRDEIVFQNLDALPDRSESHFLDAANQLVYTYAGDISTTLDYLEEENSDTSSFFYGKLDLDHIGLIGHSTGGGADVVVALNDDRITALIGLDAWVEPILKEDIVRGLDIPALFLRSETWEEGFNNANLYDLILASNQASLYQIQGTTHSDFSMAYMFSPLMRLIGYTGSLDKEYLVDMQKDIMILFFDEHLKSVIREDIDLSVYHELIWIDISA